MGGYKWNVLDGILDRGLIFILIEGELDVGSLVIIRHSGHLVQLGSDGQVEGDELDDEFLEVVEVGLVLVDVKREDDINIIADCNR